MRKQTQITNLISILRRMHKQQQKISQMSTKSKYFPIPSLTPTKPPNPSKQQISGHIIKTFPNKSNRVQASSFIIKQRAPFHKQEYSNNSKDNKDHKDGKIIVMKTCRIGTQTYHGSGRNKREYSLADNGKGYKGKYGVFWELRQPAQSNLINTNDDKHMRKLKTQAISNIQSPSHTQPSQSPTKPLQSTLRIPPRVQLFQLSPQTPHKKSIHISTNKDNNINNFTTQSTVHNKSLTNNNNNINSNNYGKNLQQNRSVKINKYSEYCKQMQNKYNNSFHHQQKDQNFADHQGTNAEQQQQSDQIIRHHRANKIKYNNNQSNWILNRQLKKVRKIDLKARLKSQDQYQDEAIVHKFDQVVAKAIHQIQRIDSMSHDEDCLTPKMITGTVQQNKFYAVQPVKQDKQLNKINYHHTEYIDLSVDVQQNTKIQPHKSPKSSIKKQLFSNGYHSYINNNVQNLSPCSNKAILNINKHLTPKNNVSITTNINNINNNNNNISSNQNSNNNTNRRQTNVINGPIKKQKQTQDNNQIQIDGWQVKPSIRIYFNQSSNSRANSLNSANGDFN